MNNPIVSVIVPVFGVEKYIRACAESLFRQTYQYCEFVFVNDSTRDKSIDILLDVVNTFPDTLRDRVKIINHEHNMGLAQARNTGVLKSSGIYVMHVDSDDTVVPTAVEKAVCCAQCENADIVICGMLHQKGSGTVIEHVSIPEKKKEYINQLIQRKASVCLCGSLFARSLYVDNNVWAVPGVNMGEDYSTKPRLVYYAKKIVGLNEPIYIYNHLNEGSYTKSFNQAQINSLDLAVSVLSDFFSSVDDAHDYLKSLDVARLSAKVILLKNWALSDSTKDAFCDIQNLYSNVDISLVESKVDHLVLLFSKHNNSFLVRVFVKLGHIAKSVFRKI